VIIIEVDYLFSETFNLIGYFDRPVKMAPVTVNRPPAMSIMKFRFPSISLNKNIPYKDAINGGPLAPLKKILLIWNQIFCCFETYLPIGKVIAWLKLELAIKKQLFAMPHMHPERKLGKIAFMFT
jgi:hypothetical protein